MVATVNTVRAPSAVRIVARAFDFRPHEIDALSRKVPWGGADKLGEMLAGRPELAGHDFQSPHYRRLVGLAERLAGFPYTWARTWAGSSSRATRSPTACRCSGRPRA